MQTQTTTGEWPRRGAAPLACGEVARTATDGFKFWDAYYDALKLLDTDEERGHFVMALCAYVFEDKEPQLTGMERFGFELISKQAMESKRLCARARENGRKGGEASGESRRAASGKFSTNEFSTSRRSGASSMASTERKKDPPSKEGGGAAGAGPWGPAPPRLEDLPPIPGQRDTNGGDRE